MPVSINNLLWLFREVCTGLRTSMLHCKAVNPNKLILKKRGGNDLSLAEGGWGRRHVSAVMTQQGEGAVSVLE